MDNQKTLIKIDRNGSKHFKGMIECDRCFGKGYYAVGILNGQPVLSSLDHGVCWKCKGVGKVLGKWIERTPEYQAKLDARRQAKLDAQQAIIQAKRLEEERLAEEKRLQEEARIKALKSISQHVGNVGEKIVIKGTYVKSAWFDIPSYRGFGTDTMYIHTFKDADGNVFIWKTSKALCKEIKTPIKGSDDWEMKYELIEEGTEVILKGSIKEHSEYQDEKQTVLTRCKFL